MGMRDVNGILSVAQAVTSTGDTVSTNQYDNGSANTAEIGLQDETWLSVLCSTTATSGGAATVQAVLQDSADGSTWADVIAGAALPVASVIAGATLMQLCVPIGTRRYLRVVYRVGTAALTAGKFEAYFSFDIQKNVSRPSGFTVA
jgi:hypothetical protein